MMARTPKAGRHTPPCKLDSRVLIHSAVVEFTETLRRIYSEDMKKLEGVDPILRARAELLQQDALDDEQVKHSVHQAHVNAQSLAAQRLAAIDTFINKLDKELAELMSADIQKNVMGALMQAKIDAELDNMRLLEAAEVEAATMQRERTERHATNEARGETMKQEAHRRMRTSPDADCRSLAKLPELMSYMQKWTSELH